MNFRFEQTSSDGVVSEEQESVEEAVLTCEPLKNSCILKEWYQIIMNLAICFDTLQNSSTAIRVLGLCS